MHATATIDDGGLGAIFSAAFGAALAAWLLYLSFRRAIVTAGHGDAPSTAISRLYGLLLVLIGIQTIGAAWMAAASSPALLVKMP